MNWTMRHVKPIDGVRHLDLRFGFHWTQRHVRPIDASGTRLAIRVSLVTPVSPIFGTAFIGPLDGEGLQTIRLSVASRAEP